MVRHLRHRRSVRYRQRGPEPYAPAERLAGDARRKLFRNALPAVLSAPPRGLLGATVAAAVGAVGLRKHLGVPRKVSLSIVSATPLVVAAAVPLGKWRYVAVGAAYMWAFKVTWEMPYDEPQKLRQAVRVRYPIRIDSVLGGGVPPTLRLQRALRDHRRVVMFDRAVALIYSSWFVPHLLLGWLLLHHEQFLPRAAGRLAATYHLTTPFYWLLPTAPPWWASEQAGEMGGEVERVLRHVLRDLRDKPKSTTDQTPGNPWGSMPSDHIASAAITAAALAEVNVLYGALGWTYVALASFAVVYLGEHYLIDVLAGLAVAEVVRRVEPLVSPFARTSAQFLKSFTADRVGDRAGWLIRAV